MTPSYWQSLDQNPKLIQLLTHHWIKTASEAVLTPQQLTPLFLLRAVQLLGKGGGGGTLPRSPHCAGNLSPLAPTTAQVLQPFSTHCTGSMVPSPGSLPAHCSTPESKGRKQKPEKGDHRPQLSQQHEQWEK